MDWNASTVWWLVAGVLVAAELATGTFYLLMIALGCAAGALAALASMPVTVQVVAAALLGGGATYGWHLSRKSQPKAEPSERNRDVNLDIGQSVQVPAWGPDGTARVQYRGAAWSVRLEPGHACTAGLHIIVAMQGSELRVAPAPHP
jgi:membrane protein implicated in regulation of membrane protease activity